MDLGIQLLYYIYWEKLPQETISAVSKNIGPNKREFVKTSPLFYYFDKHGLDIPKIMSDVFTVSQK